MMNFLIMAALTISTVKTPLALPPFTFAGRLTDAAHAAFDAADLAEVRVYTADGATLLAKSSTGVSTESSYNFAIDIPVATVAQAGYALVGTKVKLFFVDGDGNRYDSIVSEADAVVGNPGECTYLTAFLGTDANKDGIADEYAELYLLYGQCLGYDIETFDANADYDGDGQSNLAEYIAGTDPFLAEDVFDTQAISIDFWPKDDAGMTLHDWTRVTFPTEKGRCYSIYTTSALDDGGTWELGTFSYTPYLDGLSETFHVTGSSESRRCSLYLPKDVARRFWRIVVE